MQALLGLIIGIVWLSRMGQLPALGPLLLLLGLALVFWVLLAKLPAFEYTPAYPVLSLHQILIRSVRQFFIFCICVLAGVCFGTFRGQGLLAQQLPETFSHQSYVVSGTIEGLVDQNQRRQRFTLRLESLLDKFGFDCLHEGLEPSPVNVSLTGPKKNAKKRSKKPAAEALPQSSLCSQTLAGANSTNSFNDKSLSNGALASLKRLRISWYAPRSARPSKAGGFNVRVLKPGQTVTATVVLKRPRGFANPGGFDYQAMLISRGIGATGYVRKLHSVTSTGTPGIRWRLLKFLDRLSLQNIPYIKGLLLGDRSGLLPADWNRLSQTGTGHLLAISGLHIGLVASLGFVLGALLGRLWQLRVNTPLGSEQIACACSFFSALAYGYLADFSLPTQRALLMLSVFLCARLLGREIHPLRVLLWALLLVLMFDPLALEQVGACLSFAAVAALVYGFYGRQQPKRHGFLPKLWAFVCSLLWAQCLLAFFLCAALFALALPSGQLGLVANLLAIPLLSLAIMPLLFLAAASWLLGFELLWLWQWADFLIGILLAFLQLLVDVHRDVAPFLTEALSLGEQTLSAPSTEPVLALWWLPIPYSVWALLLLLLLSLLLFLPGAIPGRYLAVAPALLLLFPNSYLRPPDDSLSVSVLDVGQGLAVVMRRGDEALVYDTGPAFSERFNAGSAIVAPYLRRQGIRKIQWMILSHGDSDHAGGYPALAEQFTIAELWQEPKAHRRQLESRSAPLPFRGQKRAACWRGGQKIWRGLTVTSLWPSADVLAEASPKVAHKRNNRSCVVLLQYQGFKILLTGDIERWAEARLLALPSLNAREGSSHPLAKVDILFAPHHGSKSSSSLAFAQMTQPRWLISSTAYRNRYGHPHPEVLARYPNSQQLNTAEHGAIEFHIRQSAEGIWQLAPPKLYREHERRFWY